MDLLGLLQQFGPFLGLVLFYVWRDYKREQRLSATLETTNQWIKDLMLPALNNSTKAIEAVAQVISENNTILTGIHQIMQTHILITEATNKILERLTKSPKGRKP